MKLFYLLGRFTGGMSSAIVLNIARNGFTFTGNEGITLVTLNTFTVFDCFSRVVTAHGVGSTSHRTTTANGHTHIVRYVPLVPIETATHIFITIGKLTAIDVVQTFGSRFTMVAIALKTPKAKTFIAIIGLVIDACSLRMA